MFNFESRIYEGLIVLLILMCTIDCMERKLDAEINPGCERIPLCNGTNPPFTVVHVIATGSNDSIHYLWDFEGKPSLLLAITSHNATLSIDWEKFLMGEKSTVTFSEEPLYTFGVILNKFYEYDDVNNTGLLNFSTMNQSLIKELDTKEFYWKKLSFIQDEKDVVLVMAGTNITKNGSVKIMLNGYGFQDHSKDLPHLLHSENSSLFEIEIDNLGTEPTFSNSRFAVELVLASKDAHDKQMTIDVRKSLDDEESPGVFTLVDVLTPSSYSGNGGGYLQWRPVAYISQTRSLANSTETNSYAIENITDPSTVLQNTLFHSYYGPDIVNLLIQSTIVSFGSTDDGYYKKTNYTSWAFTVGYGHPPNEDFSLLVILVISIGLGLPAILIIVSGIVFAVRRCTHKKDELCLSR